MSYGQQLVKRFLEAFEINEYIENYRPEWLFGMELDFYVEKKKFAIEFNGDQHYMFTTYGSPDEQIKRDLLKREICKRNGIRLISIHAGELYYHQLRAKFRVSKKTMKRNENELLEIQKDVSKYRTLLRRKYGKRSMTTMRPSEARREIKSKYKESKKRIKKLMRFTNV